MVETESATLVGERPVKGLGRRRTVYPTAVQRTWLVCKLTAARRATVS